MCETGPGVFNPSPVTRSTTREAGPTRPASAAAPRAPSVTPVAVSPNTPVEAASELDGYADILLCMTVNPGWGGQPFIPSSPQKVQRMRQALGRAAIEVDGGIDPTTAPSVADAGAGLFVAGSAIFGAPDPAEAYRAIADAAGAE